MKAGTEPAPNGSGAQRRMRAALADARITREDVDYINAPGTSTILNDISETQAIQGVFQDHAPKLQISSTKSMMGHSWVLQERLRRRSVRLVCSGKCLPPTINLEDPDTQCTLVGKGWIPPKIRIETAFCCPNYARANGRWPAHKMESSFCVPALHQIPLDALRITAG
jgi:3-oxoacyl-[acyl-carrier-protein] synthase II